MGFYRYTLFYRVLFAAVEIVIYCKFRHEVTVFLPKLKYIYIMIKLKYELTCLNTLNLLADYIFSMSMDSFIGIRTKVCEFCNILYTEKLFENEREHVFQP